MIEINDGYTQLNRQFNQVMASYKLKTIYIARSGQYHHILSRLKKDEPRHVTTRDICHVACFFFIYKNNTTECISYITTKLKMRTEMDYCLARIS